MHGTSESRTGSCSRWRHDCSTAVTSPQLARKWLAAARPNRMELSMWRHACIASLAVLVLHAQGTKPREKPADYHVQSRIPGFDLAAEYLAHSMPEQGGVIDVNEYLVIELAVFPTTTAAPTVTSGEFTLRVTNNRGHKSVLSAQAPGMVAASP